MTTREPIPGMITSSAVLMRHQAGNDPAMRSAINNHDYEQSPDNVLMKIQPGTSDAIHSIYDGDLVVTPLPWYRSSICGDIDTSTTEGRLPIYAQSVGLPSWVSSAKYVGPQEDRKKALADHLLLSVRFAGLAAGNSFQGGDNSTPYTTGTPLNIWGMRTVFLPVTKALYPMQSVKLAIAQTGMASELKKGVPFTVEPVTNESIVRQMMAASRAYSKSITKKEGRELLFTNLDKQNKMMASLTMRKECEVGHMFMLGILGSALHVATILLEGEVPILTEGAGEEQRQASAGAGARKDALDTLVRRFNDVFLHKGESDAKVKETAAILEKIAAKTESKMSTHGQLLDNMKRNGLNNVAMAVSEQILSPLNKPIGKVIQEEDGGSSGGNSYRKFILNYSVV